MIRDNSMHAKPNSNKKVSTPYLAFIDGSLDYNCKICPHNCCMGHGFGGMEDGALGPLMENHPELLMWIQSRDKGHMLLSTPPSGCLFLQKNGLCKIEIVHGRNAKPGVCLMFPFNNIQRIDDHLIIRPHFLCKFFEPVIPPRPGFVNGSHNKIIRDFNATGIFNKVVSKIELRKNEKVHNLLAKERHFLAVCSKGLGSERASETIMNFSQDAGTVSSNVNRSLRLLGINLPQNDKKKDHFDDLFHLLMPSMRIDYLALPLEGISLCMLLAEALCRASFIGMDRLPTLADLVSFFQVMQPTLRVLGYGEAPFEPLIDWQPDGSRPPLDCTDHKVAFGVMIVLTGKGYGTLRALEEAMTGMSRPVDRLLFIRRLAALSKNIERITGESKKNN